MKRSMILAAVVIGLMAVPALAAEDSDEMTYKGKISYGASTWIGTSGESPVGEVDFVGRFLVTGMGDWGSIIVSDDSNEKDDVAKVGDPLELIRFSRTGSFFRVTSDAYGPKIVAQVDTDTNDDDLSVTVSDEFNSVTAGASANGDFTGTDEYALAGYASIPLVRDLELGGAVAMQTVPNATDPASVENLALGVKLSGEAMPHLDVEAVYLNKQADFTGSGTFQKLEGTYTVDELQGKASWEHNGLAEDDPTVWNDNTLSAAVIYRGGKHNPVDIEGNYDEQFAYDRFYESDGVGAMAKLSIDYGEATYGETPDATIEVAAVSPFAEALWGKAYVKVYSDADENPGLADPNSYWVQNKLTLNGRLYYAFSDDLAIIPYMHYYTTGGVTDWMGNPTTGYGYTYVGANLKRYLSEHSDVYLDVAHDSGTEYGGAEWSEIEVHVGFELEF